MKTCRVYFFVSVLSVALTVFGEEDGAPSVVLDLPPSGTNCRNSEGDFVRLMDGRILFVYSHFTKGTGADGDPAYLASRASSDGEAPEERRSRCGLE